MKNSLRITILALMLTSFSTKHLNGQENTLRHAIAVRPGFIYPGINYNLIYRSTNLPSFEWIAVTGFHYRAAINSDLYKPTAYFPLQLDVCWIPGINKEEKTHHFILGLRGGTSLYLVPYGNNRMFVDPFPVAI